MADVRSPAIQLHRSMEELKVFFDLVRSLENIRRTPPSEMADFAPLLALSPALASTAWRRQYYAALVVGLYGVHERFVRDLASSSARLLKLTYERFDDLPERTKKENIRLTLRHLQDLADRAEINQHELQTNMLQLNSCLDGIVSVNDAVLAKNTANFRTNVIRDVLGRIDLLLPDPQDDASLMGALDGVLNGVYSAPSAAVDDLADRRNDIAHGSDFDLLDFDTLAGLADLIYAFDSWLFRSVVRLQLRGLVQRNGFKVANVDRVWTNASTGLRSIARLLDVAHPIERGARLYMGESSVPCSALEIQVDRVARSNAEPGQGPFGVDVGATVKPNAEVRLLGTRWREPEHALLGVLDERPRFLFGEGVIG